MDNKTHTLQELIREARVRLAAEYGEREAAALVDEALLRIKGWSRTDTAIRRGDEVSEFLMQKVDATIDRLLKGEPIQYIFGKSHFYGMDFSVTTDTLIPRPETALLVDMIVDRYGNKTDLKVLDLGTGSGCIAIALGRHLTFTREVTAVDISEGALSVAAKNASDFKVKVNFIRGDMLADDFAYRLDGKFDIMVSNPPYIGRCEATCMERNVVDHEPERALFVPDDDPLLFYRAIARIASQRLEANGTLFLEINPLFVKELVKMLHDYGFNDTDVEKDMQQSDRFIIAKR